MPQQYPFSAVIGCHRDELDDMGLALILTTIAPQIGGVLIRGEKGTAKSTAVRALSAVLPPIEVYAADRFSIDPANRAAKSPDGPFDGAEITTRPVRLVELPVGATEDRVLGSLQLESALSQGKVEFEPGLLARAHRGILYVDEVNLLHDHLVDLLLDAAAMGQVSVERDGVSVEHDARFVLIGTMNPEEGELRPQLLDRFGLTVEVAAPRDPQLRTEVVRRRIAYDLDPETFNARFAVDEAELTERITAARERVPQVELTDAALLKIAEVCAAFDVDGLRADIVTARTAVAHAAWYGRLSVTRADIRQAALLALPHRRRRNPFDAPGLDEDLLDQVLADHEPEPEPPSGPEDAAEDSTESAGPDTGTSTDGPDTVGPDSPGQSSAGDIPEPLSSSADDTLSGEPMSQPGADSPGTSVPVAANAPYRTKLLTVAGTGQGAAGRRSRALASTGRRIGACEVADGSGSLHLIETLKAAAGKQVSRARVDGRVALRNEDLRLAVREGQEANLVLFCVDASGSMAARKRMAPVKTAILSLLLDAYRRRDKVGLITFRGGGAELNLPPTHSVDIAATLLDDLPGGGRTPLAEGLLEAARVIERERVRDRHLRTLLVVVTDGRATGGTNAVHRSQQAANYVASLGVTTVVVDGETGPLRMGLARQLAVIMAAEHLPVEAVSAEALTTTVRAHTRSQLGAA